MQTLIAKIQKQVNKSKGDALCQAVGDLLLAMAGKSEEWKNIISKDLDNKEMSIQAAADRLRETAKKKQKNGSYFMHPNEAEQLLVKLYCLPELVSADMLDPKKNEPDTEEQDDFDLFGDL